MEDHLTAALQKPTSASKKYAFAKFAAIVLGVLAVIALGAIVGAIAIGAEKHVAWLGVVAATSAGGLALLSLGYVLGQSALDMILTKAIGIVAEAKQIGRQP